jgi:hypothetical protein
MSDIWKRRQEIDKARREKEKELMDEYDSSVYYPAKKQLIEDCKNIGHYGNNFHDNGFGWCWFYCAGCGGRYNIQGPDGKSE